VWNSSQGSEYEGDRWTGEKTKETARKQNMCRRNLPKEQRNSKERKGILKRKNWDIRKKTQPASRTF
jgi:hypothetical protein